jgi:ribonuclease J
MKSDLLNITPLGGVGQIGSNMTLIEHGKSKIIVDCGILFPYEDFFGINYLIPDMRDLSNPTDLIITHGHEDHIGAIAHFLEFFPNITIYAPLFAAKLIHRKLGFLKKDTEIILYKSDSTLKIRDIQVDPIKVNHSIPDTYGIHFSIMNKISLFLISDFKIDHITPYEKPFDFQKLQKVSRGFAKKVLLADSTNILSSQTKTPSEISIKNSLHDIIKNHSQNIFVSTFSSNVHRIQTLVDICAEENIPIIAIGRSMKSYIEVGLDTCHLTESRKIHFELGPEISKSNKKLFILSGCQADFRSALRRVITGTDKYITPKAGDALIMSSKAIPGNEKKVGMILNKASELGLHLYTAHNSEVHVSGHPGKEDLKELYENYKPDIAIPIHGESYFIKEHQAFVQDTFPSIECHTLLNFSSINFKANLSFKVKACEKKDPIIIHGKGIELPKSTISERRKMATLGQVFISIQKNQSIKLSTCGIPDNEGLLIEEIHSHCLTYIELLRQGNRLSQSDLSEEIRISARNFIAEKLGYKPIVTIHNL